MQDALRFNGFLTFLNNWRLSTPQMMQHCTFAAAP